MNLIDASNKLTKWRIVFAGWQLGTRDKSDPECQAVKDHREVTMLLRAEVSALTRILLERGVISEQNLTRIMQEEIEALDALYETRFPGITTSLDGVHFTMPEAAETMKGWPA